MSTKKKTIKKVSKKVAPQRGTKTIQKKPAKPLAAKKITTAFR